MKIDGKKISSKLLAHLKKELKSYKKTKSKPKVVVFSVRPNSGDLAFIKTKERAAAEIGADFELILFKKIPRFEDFAVTLRQKAEDPKTTAVIIQKPLPQQLSTETLYNYVPTIKEIEGHKAKSPYYPPIGLAVLTIFKFIFDPSDKKKVENLLVDLPADTSFFKNVFKRKKIVVMGKGETGGKPIGDVLSAVKLNYINTHSKTPTSSPFYKEADVIISAAGRKVIVPSMLKKGVVLVNVGIRKEAGEWKGDYDEEEINDIASFYTPTPGGVGPLDIAYLMYNTIKAFKLQKK